MKKSLILTGAVALFSLIASAKSYEIALSNPTMVGSTQLQAGEYNVKVKGNVATFTNQDTLKSFQAPVKIEQAPTKFDETAVESTKQDGADHMNAIDLGGSTTKLELGE